MKEKEKDLEQLPPHDAEAERALVGCCLLDSAVIGDVLERFKGALDVFYESIPHLLWPVLVAMHEARQPVDLVTVRGELKARQLDERVTVSELGDLMALVPSAANWPAYADAVREQWLRRRMLRVCQAGVAAMLDTKTTTALALAETERALHGVAEQGVANVAKRLGTYMPLIQDRLETFVRGHKMMLGLPTGFNYLDNMLCGLRGGDYVVIAARPGVGKTSIVTQMGLHAACELKLPVAFFSMEMTGMSLAERIWFGESRADYQKYRNGFLVERDVALMTAAAPRLAKAPLFIDDSSGVGIQQLTVKARRLKRQEGIRLIVVDYLQLMPADPGRESDLRTRELAEVSMGLKRLAKELDVPVVVLAQMNRNTEQDHRKNSKPQLSDLGECGQIERDADVVAFLYRVNIKDKEDLDGPGMAWLKKCDVPARGQDDPDNWWEKHVTRVNLFVAKQRNGPTGDCDLVYYNRRMQFKDLHRPRREEEVGV